MITYEGVKISIKWAGMSIGSSFYLPTLNNKDLYSLVQAEALRHGIETVYKGTKEGNTMGIRVWRVK